MIKTCFALTACVALCIGSSDPRPSLGAETPAAGCRHETGNLLFDGETFDGWTTVAGDPVPKGWEIVDGTIHLNSSGSRPGNIVTQREYGDFDLRFEWKISAGGNNGIKYRVREYGKQVLGCEYQLIDDNSYMGEGHGSAKGSTGSIYDLYPPNDAKYLNPPGQFNQSRIVVCGNRIEHWLNGRLIVSACVGSCDWYRKKAESKFSDLEGFGENRYGKIMLTDHKTEVWYRNMVIRELPPAEPSTLVETRRLGGPRVYPGLGQLLGSGSLLRRHR
jgi:hypothetical protein